LTKVTAEEVAGFSHHPGLSPAGVFLAVHGELAVGLAVARVAVPGWGQQKRQGALELLAVRPGYRRQGIGRALVYAVLTWLVHQGVSTVGVSAEESTLLAVLENYGFQPASTSR
jgi:GNAT superfamily N-acetyltransferase